MSVTCEICGKEFKNAQGLRGHKTFVHQMSTTQAPPPRLAAEQELSEVEEAVTQIVTLLKQMVHVLNKQWQIDENHIMDSRSIAEQVNNLTTQLNKVQIENRKLSEGISKNDGDIIQLKLNLKNLSRYFGVS